jgi:hypothetical protein
MIFQADLTTLCSYITALPPLLDTVADPGGARGAMAPPKRYERNFFFNEPLDNVVGNVKIFSARFARNYSTHIQYKAVLNLPNLVMIF